MKKLLTPLFLFLSLSLFSQVPGWNWSSVSGGMNYDLGSSVTTDPSGNVIACGYYSGDTAFFGSNSLTCAGLNDYFITKYDPNGNVIWAKHNGGDGDDYAISIATNAAGEVYVVGYFLSDTLIIGNDTLYDLNSGYSDIFIAKYDASGNPVWAKKYGGGSWDIAQGVVVEQSTGNFYVAGCYYDSSITIGTQTLSNYGLYDMLLMKFSPSGNPIWATAAGGNLNDMGNAVALDASGNVFISGGFASALMIFPCCNLVNANPGLPDIFVLKYDSNGSNIWRMRAGSTDNDHSVAVATDPSGNVFVSGHFHSNYFLFAGDTIFNNGMGDIYLLKYANNGTELWGRGEGGNMHDFGYTVATDALGNSYIAGMFNSMYMLVGSTLLSNVNMMQDMFLIKYDPSGNHVWAISSGGTGDDEINSITIGSSNEIYVAGDWRSPTIAFGADNYVNQDSTIGYADIVVGKIDIMTGMPVSFSGNEISIYPNPSSGIFHMSGVDTPILSVEVFNVLGECVFSTKEMNSDSGIDLSTQPNGVYFVRMNTTETTFRQKVLIQK